MMSESCERKHQMTPRNFAAAALLSVLVISAACAKDPTGTPAPDFRAGDIAGNEISLSDYRGKVVLLDFWATWCAPCVEELPNVRRVYEKYGKNGFEVIGISLDVDQIDLEAFLLRERIDWPQIFDGKGWENEISRLYGVQSIPSTFLLDRNGFIRHVGLRGSDLELSVAALLDVPIDETPSARPDAGDAMPPTARAAMEGDTDRLKNLLDGGADVNAKARFGWTPLMWAAKEAHEDTARLLLSRDANVNAKTDSGFTALMVAVKEGHPETVKILLGGEVDIDAKDKRGATALSVAAGLGQSELAEFLLANGADPNAKDSHGRTALMTAVGYRHEDVVEILVKNGADVNARDKQNLTALAIASGFRESALVRILLDNGADIGDRGENGWTALT